MRTLIVSLNAKYEHENPAPWFLKAACDARNGACGDVGVLSGTINDQPGHVFARLVEACPDVVGFSCYIWNRDMMLRLCQDVKAALPAARLVAGGPEVSHADGADAFLAAGVDVVLAGEGEARFADLLEQYRLGRLPDDPQLAAWRLPGAPLGAECIPSPCSPEYLACLPGRIAYVEASRGCPYRCSYCLSSESAGVTRLPLQQVFADVAKVVGAGAKVVKFVDRTFNLSESRTLEIWRHLLRYADTPVTFHFEIAPDRVTDAQLALLGQAPPGLFQVEAGIQSVHADTLARISRKMDVDLALERIASIREAGNVHVHADLIVGLPGEGEQDVAESFDRLSRANPHHLQVGFLKLIRGTRIRREADQWGYLARAYAPYEVLASSSLSPREILMLKDFEETVERFRNSGRFLLVLQWMQTRFPSPYALFRHLADRQGEQGLLRRAVSSDTLFRFLFQMIPDIPAASWEHDTAGKLLGLDWICAHRNPFVPDWFGFGENGDPVKTNEVRMAYGEQDEASTPTQKALRNRMRGMVIRLPDAVRQGVRWVCPEADTTRGFQPVYVLVDTRRVDSVLGRPEVVVLHHMEV